KPRRWSRSSAARSDFQSSRHTPCAVALRKEKRRHTECAYYSNPMHTTDVLIVGGGIVGLGTALALAGRTSVTVVEAEKHIAQHQTGHNSGVIHSGLYYKPGSAKAKNCAEGRELMYRFCEENSIPHDRCGKLVVATDKSELPALEELERR